MSIFDQKYIKNNSQMCYFDKEIIDFDHFSKKFRLRRWNLGYSGCTNLLYHLIDRSAMDAIMCGNTRVNSRNYVQLYP